MEDGDIVELYWRRAENAIRETTAKYGKYCYAIAYNILACREDAAESVNDTYLDAWNSIPPHRPTDLATFLGKITRRRAIDRWRKQHSDKRGQGETALVVEELAECLPSGHNVEQEAAAAELSRSIEKFLSGLPATERRVFVCRYWYLDPVAAISRQFAFTPSKVKSMLGRTRAKLRLYLQQEGVYDES